MATVEVNGTKLEYTSKGAGQAVVFVHPHVSDARCWANQVDAFAAKHRVVTYRRRYARPNADIPEGGDDRTMDHVEDLAALLRTLGVAPAHLVGNSSGAYAPLLLALRNPELVQTPVLCEPPVVSFDA